MRAAGVKRRCVRQPIRECADHPRAPPDLAQDALERVVGADTPPMRLRKGVVGRSRSASLDPASASSAALVSRDARSLSITRMAFSRAAAMSSLAVDRLEHGCDLPHLGRRHMAEDVAIPVCTMRRRAARCRLKPFTPRSSSPTIRLPMLDRPIFSVRAKVFCLETGFLVESAAASDVARLIDAVLKVARSL